MSPSHIISTAHSFPVIRILLLDPKAGGISETKRSLAQVSQVLTHGLAVLGTRFVRRMGQSSVALSEYFGVCVGFGS
jgi:hypothetical protein